MTRRLDKKNHKLHKENEVLRSDLKEEVGKAVLLEFEDEMLGVRASLGEVVETQRDLATTTKWLSTNMNWRIRENSQLRIEGYNLRRSIKNQRAHFDQAQRVQMVINLLLGGGLILAILGLVL